MSMQDSLASVSSGGSSRRRRKREREGWFAAWRPRTGLAVPLVTLLLFGAPLYMGGALAPAVPLWATVACLAFAITGVEARVLRNDLWVRCGALVIAVSVLQLLPLPGFLLRALDPVSADVSAGALAALREDRAYAWRPLHMDPGNGYAILQSFVGFLAAYLASRRLAYRGYASVLYSAAAHSTLWLSVIALVHAQWGLDKVYGFYQPRGAAPPILSPLLNPNHLAAFTGVGTLLWLGRAAASETSVWRIANTSAAFLCGAVCALSLSRGGVAATFAGVLVFMVTVAWLRNAEKRRSSSRFLQSALAGAAVLSVSGWVALEQLRAEYATGDLSKLRFFGAVARTVGTHWMLGAGAGAASVAVAVNESVPGDVTVEWAENLPIDLALAFGVPVALALLWLGGRALWSLRPSPRTSGPYALAAFCALCSLVLHDMADFSLWLAANGYLAAVLSGMIAGEHAHRAEPLNSKPIASIRWPALLVTAFCVAAVAVTLRSPLYLARERTLASLTEGPLPAGELRRMLLRHPADAFLPLSAGVTALQNRQPDGLRHINRALRLAPGWTQPHLFLTELFFRRGLRAQALGELRRAAALSSQHHGVLAGLLLSQRETLTEQDLRAAIPEGSRGVALLREIAGRSPGNEEILSPVDAILRERVPGDLDVSLREAARIIHRGDRPGGVSLIEAAVRREPTATRGYLSLAATHAQGDDLAAAVRTIRAGIVRVPRNRELVMTLAEYLTRQRDVAAMREAMQQAFDIAGSNIDERIETFGLLGRLEMQLRNEGEALSAFERADAMAYPAHPYLGQILSIVHGMGDQRRLRDVCNTLRETETMTAAQRGLCAEADRRAPEVTP